MIAQFSFITGMMLGIEYVDSSDDEYVDGKNIVIDLFILRMVFSWGFDE